MWRGWAAGWGQAIPQHRSSPFPMRSALPAPPSPTSAGLLLYGVDLVLRAGQLCNVTAVVAASVDEAAGTATLQLQADKVRRLHCPAWPGLASASRFHADVHAPLGSAWL